MWLAAAGDNAGQSAAVRATDMTDPTKCERCGQVDCPTLLWHDDKRRWSAAFHACAAMGIRVEMQQAREDRHPDKYGKQAPPR